MATRPLAIGVAFIGLVTAASLLTSQATSSKIVVPHALKAPAPLNEPKPIPRVENAAQIRPVKPDVFGVPSLEAQELERIEPREPLSPLGRALSPSEGPPKETILHRPLVTSAGTFSSLGHNVRIKGLIPTDPAQECSDNGQNWPCGVHARTAFRNWLRGRALACVVPPVAAKEVVISDCNLGKLSAGEWLVSQGWARAEAGGPYVALEAEAKKEKRGLFSPAPSVSEMPLSAPNDTLPSGD